MQVAWQNLALLALAQLSLFVVCAIYENYEKRFFDIRRILWRGTFIGIAIGLLSELLWGELFGLWSYVLGHSAFAMILTVTLVYGLFAGNVLLLQQARFPRFFVWVTLITAVYETINYFFRVWTYELSLPLLGFLLFLMAGYLATAMFIAAVWHFLGYRFLFIDNLLKR